MDSLRELISQLDEIEQFRRDKRMEMFLTFVGVFALGSLVLDITCAMSFVEQIPESVLLLLSMGIPAVFLVIAYLLLRD